MSILEGRSETMVRSVAFRAPLTEIRAIVLDVTVHRNNPGDCCVYYGLFTSDIHVSISESISNGKLGTAIVNHPRSRDSGPAACGFLVCSHSNHRPILMLAQTYRSVVRLRNNWSSVCLIAAGLKRCNCKHDSQRT